MRIKYFGNSAFLFKGKQTKLVTNPSDKGAKINLKKIAPDIVVLSHKGDISKNDYYIIFSPGEYEVKDFFVYGFLSDLSQSRQNQADIYMLDVEDVHIGIIDKAVSRVRSWVLDEMGIVDILLISLAGDSGMKLKGIVDLVSQIEPYIVIPMDYTDQLLEEFVKAMGIGRPEEDSKLDVKSLDFEDEEAPVRVVVLGK